MDAATPLLRVPVRKPAAQQAAESRSQARSSTQATTTPPKKATVGKKRGKGNAPRGRGFQKGHDPRRNKDGGKAKATYQKVNDVKLEVLAAFEELGGRKFLVKLGKEDRKAFAGLLSKLIPQEVTGKGGAPLLGDVQLHQITNNILALPTADLEAFVRMLGKLGANLALPGMPVEGA